MTDLKKIHLENEGATKSLDGRVIRKNAGKNHWYLVNGNKADGVTGVLSGSVPKNLTGWAAGTVAEQFFDDPALFEALKKLGRDGFIKAAKDMPFADRDKAAKRGTEVHKLAELAGIGEEVEVPDELAGHFDQYLDYRETHEPRNEMFEVTVAHLKYEYAGTLDTWGHLPFLKGMVAEFPTGPKVICECEDECLSIIDLKTSRSGIYSETAYQLEAYRNASHYIDAAGELREMPEIRHSVALWLTGTGWELIPFDPTPMDFRIFLYMQQVSRATDWKKGRFSTIKGEALPIPRRSKES